MPNGPLSKKGEEDENRVDGELGCHMCSVSCEVEGAVESTGASRDDEQKQMCLGPPVNACQLTH